MIGSFLLLIGSSGVLTFGVYLQFRLRSQVRRGIEAAPEGPRVIEVDGEAYFEGEEP